MSRSKTVATWLALLAGSVGAHRLYLHGPRDGWAWLHALPTALGAYGAWRMRSLGLDDRMGSMLVPLLGLMVAGTMLTAIVYGLTPDEKWDARRNAGVASRPSGWGAILGVIAALLLGATAIMATIAFSGQRVFEWLAG